MTAQVAQHNTTAEKCTGSFLYLSFTWGAVCAVGLSSRRHGTFCGSVGSGGVLPEAVFQRPLPVAAVHDRHVIHKTTLLSRCISSNRSIIGRFGQSSGVRRHRLPAS